MDVLIQFHSFVSENNKEPYSLEFKETSPI
ncbi:MAG: hypothetical protein ACJAZT_001985 [Gammaproteobacteria bacterium]|jgi:hypothetical protein